MIKQLKLSRCKHTNYNRMFPTAIFHSHSPVSQIVLQLIFPIGLHRSNASASLTKIDCPIFASVVLTHYYYLKILGNYYYTAWSLHYRDVCCTCACEALGGMWVWGLLTSQDSWYCAWSIFKFSFYQQFLRLESKNTSKQLSECVNVFFPLLHCVK